MKTRAGEKIGWIGGWSGGFIWLLILGAIWLFKGQTALALTAIALVALSAGCIFWFAPWRHPETPYWRLLLPIYAVFLISVGFAVLTGGFSSMTLSWWSVFWVLPILIPLVTVGKRTWNQ